MKLRLPLATLLLAAACGRGDRATTTPTTPAADEAAPTAAAVLEPRSGSDVQGLAAFREQDGGVLATITITGAERPGAHGIHIHERGDCSAPDATSAGDHFAPRRQPHGPPGAESHAGDMGNIEVDEAGTGVLEVFLPDTSLDPDRPDSLVGRAVILHAEEDDLVSQPSGDAGARIACGVVERTGP